MRIRPPAQVRSCGWLEIQEDRVGSKFFSPETRKLNTDILKCSSCRLKVAHLHWQVVSYLPTF